MKLAFVMRVSLGGVEEPSWNVCGSCSMARESGIVVVKLSSHSGDAPADSDIESVFSTSTLLFSAVATSTSNGAAMSEFNDVLSGVGASQAWLFVVAAVSGTLLALTLILATFDWIMPRLLPVPMMKSSEGVRWWMRSPRAGSLSPNDARLVSMPPENHQMLWLGRSMMPLQIDKA